MKKSNLVLSTVFIALLAAGCGQNDTRTNTSEEEEVVVIPISVELTVPESGKAGEAVPLEAEVSQGDEKVTDASEVEYEIWEDGKKEESWKVQSDQKTEGLYEGEAIFDHDGVYHVQVHVTARDMHTMPMKKITIGEGAVVENTGTEAETSHEGPHATEGFSMHFEDPESVKVEKPAAMTVHLQQDANPLEKARVRLEIVVNEKKDQAQWVKLTEEKPGEYVGGVTFDASGTASVTVHVENDEGLHEHETHKIAISD